MADLTYVFIRAEAPVGSPPIIEYMRLAVDLVTSLGWPLFALAFMFIFRTELKAALASIELLKVGNGELRFRKRLGDAEERSASLTRVVSAPVVTPDASALRAHPTGVVMETWKEVEAELRALADRGAVGGEIAVSALPPLPAYKLIERLRAQQLLNADEAGLAHELRGLRNDVAHSLKVRITEESAKDFVRLANVLLARVRSKQNIAPKA